MVKILTPMSFDKEKLPLFLLAFLQGLVTFCLSYIYIYISLVVWWWCFRTCKTYVYIYIYIANGQGSEQWHFLWVFKWILHWFAPICADLRRFALICADLHIFLLHHCSAHWVFRPFEKVFLVFWGTLHSLLVFRTYGAPNWWPIHWSGSWLVVHQPDQIASIWGRSVTTVLN